MRWPPARHHLGSLSHPCRPPHMKCQIVRITQIYIDLTQCNSLTLPQPAVWSWTWKFGENTKQCRQPRHSSNMHASFVSECCIMGYSVPFIAHMTFGNLAVKNGSTSILSAACGKPMCCPRHRATALSTAGSTRVRMTSPLYVPPSPEKTPRPRDEESAKVCPTRGCHDSPCFWIKPELHYLATRTYFSPHHLSETRWMNGFDVYVYSKWIHWKSE